MVNEAEGSVKRVKEQKQDVSSKQKGHRPRLFQPFRALGLITDHIPFVLSIRHGGKDATKPDIIIITCIGNSWTMWDAEKMTLLFVGESLPQNINAIITVGGSGGRDSVLAASGNKIYRFVRGKITHVYNSAGEDRIMENSTLYKDTKEPSNLAQIIAVGDNMLALTESGASILIWSLSKNHLIRELSICRPVADTDDVFEATCILHPSTYVDKVLLGSSQGHLQLYNFRTSTLIYTIRRQTLLSYMGIQEESTPSEESIALVDIVQTPAIDVVALIFAAGHILLLDIRYDEPIIYVHISKSSVEQGGVLSRSSVSFRTDGLAHTMAVGTRAGDIVLFDLDMHNDLEHSGIGQSGKARPARLAHTIRMAHDSSIASVQFVQGQPLLISSGTDNAIKQWFFEVGSVPKGGSLGMNSAPGQTTVPRLLKSREGHSTPPRLIRFAGESGKTILSAGGEDCVVRSVSVVRDSRSAELSQGSLQRKANQTARPLLSLKLSPVTSLSYSSTRSQDWDDLVTTHSSVSYAQSWSTRNQRMGKVHLPSSTEGKNAEVLEATTSCMSVCGNFALIGNSHGFIEMYNIQSGKYRRRFDTREEKSERIAKKTKSGVIQWRQESRRIKGSAVTGIVSDSINKTVAASTMKGSVYFFDFHTGVLVKQVATNVGIASLLLHRPTGLVAAIQDDLTIALYDMETFKMVRLFAGFGGKILDATFSPDGRWLIATSLDGFIRTFDIPTSRLINYFHTNQVATSVTFSPLGDFLATTHVASRGIYLWANRNQYLHLPLGGIDEDEVFDLQNQQTLPTLRGVDLDSLEEEDAQLRELDAGEAEFQRTFTSKPQLFAGDANNSQEESGLVTLSTMPRSRWMTLLNLDVIKARNKPKEAPKKPEKMPFFLPVGASSVPSSALNKQGYEQSMGVDRTSDENTSRRLQTLPSQGLDIESDFSRRLADALREESLERLFVYLHALTTPALDAEIRSLVYPRDVARFMQCMSRRMSQHLDFDAVQAMVAVALRVHADIIVENASHDAQDEDGVALAEALRSLMTEQHRESSRILDLTQYCMGSLAFIRDMPLV